MSLLQVSGVTKRFGALELFSDINFSIEKGEKVALIAPNGSGKSTLLRMIVGEESIDEGEIVFTKGTRVGYLPQHSDFSGYPDILSACMASIDSETSSAIDDYRRAMESGDTSQLDSVMQRMDASGAWEVERQLISLLGKLHLTDPLRPTAGLSGGESKRIALASVLIGKPDFLLLDEPTNHLDPDVVEWLEGHLSASGLTLLMVTHDRYFLDSVCDTIIELEDNAIYTYHGSYADYLERKEERQEQKSREQQSLRNLYRHELEWMRRMPQARGSKAKYRIDAFQETQEKLSGVTSDSAPTLEAESVYIGKKIFVADHVSKSYGDKVILKDFSYHFARRDRVGVIGPNGVGKSTLIKMILGHVEPDSGTIEVGETVRFGYFAQETFDFAPRQRVIDAITEHAEHFVYAGKGISAMQMLNRFLFPPARQHDYIEKLSGGELRRLQLCKVLVENPNFLIFDEPTNDLDIPTLRVLEEYLHDFDGCLLIVSHDRYFVDNLVEHLFVMEGNGITRDFPGNYSDYRDQKRASESPKPQAPSAAAREYKNRTREKTKRSYKEEQEFKKLESEMPLLESQLRELESHMSSGSLAADMLLEAGEKYQALRTSLEEKEMRWLELSELE